MRNHLLLNFLGLSVALLLAGCFPSESSKTNYTITDMRAFPYYTEKGIVRRDLNLFDRKFLLWNVMFGGDCGEECLPEIPGDTKVTIIEVQVRADNEPVWASPTAIELRVRAVESRRRIKTERVHLNAVLTAEARTWFIPFTLYGTGCEELEVSARLVHGRRPLGQPLNKIIHFKCGE